MQEDERSEIKVLAVGKEGMKHASGWTTAGFDLDAPDTEVMCGGINTKLPTHAAVWRQGNLLHFGFETAPSGLNDTGRALLQNCIAYIARFTEDVPIERTTSPLSAAGFRMTRYFLDRTMKRKGVTAQAIARSFAKPWSDTVAKLDSEAALAWVRKHWGYIRSGDGTKVTIDDDALALRLPIDRPELFTSVRRHLADKEHASRARRLLARLIPSGPGADAAPKAWTTWLDANARFLFFSEASGFTWLVDPLAKKRGRPSAELRGPARASAN